MEQLGLGSSKHQAGPTKLGISPHNLGVQVPNNHIYPKPVVRLLLPKTRMSNSCGTPFSGGVRINEKFSGNYSESAIV